MGRQINPDIYTKDYYLSNCSTITNEGQISNRFKKLFNPIKNFNHKKILDLGCGNGDLSIYLGKMGAEVVGIDYSKDAINLAKKKLSVAGKIEGKVKFYIQDAKKIKYKKNEFDIIVAIDLFEHLYPEELEIVIRNISKILKKDGLLLVHTEANKIYLNFTHMFYVYPVSSLIIFVNKLFKGKDYPNLPKDPRNELHKIQHVNEPTYYYLKKIFKKYNFEGNIEAIIPYKPILSWKDMVYNIFVWLFPLSLFWPAHLLFAYDYICVMRSKK
ncbi:MAG: class I SAM-dependent methyltransferase [Candidatus Levybacteria bacterium]|nr:class I SAM-dependent methyltransferase [Candidatus Levybacteria bacterium]